jgi:hypothetical protein
MPEARIGRGPEKVKLQEVPLVQEFPGESKVRILDVVLEQLPLPEDVNARRFIPSWSSMKSAVCWDMPTVTLVRDMAIRLAGGIPSRSEGPTGVSKSFAVEVIASLTNRGYVRHNYNKDSDPGDTIGRFVPSDEAIAVRFEELLADPKIQKDDDCIGIIEKARRASRPLTVYESKRIASVMGLGDLGDGKPWKWKNGTLTGSMAYGSIFNADEPNLASGNVVERENSALEKRPKLRLVEHEGEVVRELSPEEQSVIASGGVIPGVIGLDQRFWYSAAQNPFGIGGGRIEESEARRNRLQDRIVEALTTKEYVQFLNFLIKGDQPDIVWQNKKYKGEKNVQTNYRDLEKIPQVDVFINWLAQFQTDLKQLIEKGKIGTEKDIRGGSYILTRRNIERFLDSIKGTQKTLLDTDELFKTGRMVYNTNWHDLVMEGIYQEYLAGMYKEDADVVKDLIKASGIEDSLGPSKNNPASPAWVRKAQSRGINVQAGAGEWIMSKTDITNARVNYSLKDEIEKAGYEIVDEGDNIGLRYGRKISSILEIFLERDKKKENSVKKASKRASAKE